jgi:hypothetical protein
MTAPEFIRIAGITLRLRFAEASLLRTLPPTVRRFAADPFDGQVDVDIVVEAMPDHFATPGPLLFDSGAVWRAYQAEDGGLRIDCHSPIFGDEPYKVGLFASDFRKGRILVRQDAYNQGMHPLDYPLDELLIARLLGQGRGVELHSCGVIDRDGRGQLFVGQSGAGKTTTARVWLADGDYEIVSDDRVILRSIDGVWRMYGTPWHGEAELSSPVSAPLAAINILVQSSRTELVALAPAQAAASLLGCSFPPFYDAEALAFTLETLDRLVADVPVRALQFVPDRSVIDCVRSAA